MDARWDDEKALEALERELAVLLRRARASSAEMARALHPDLEPGAYGLLMRLELVGPQRGTDLAAFFGVGKATMSRQLRALEGLGLVSREPDPADGRASWIALTEEGRRRFTGVRSARRARYLELTASWPPGEMAELARLLHRLNDLTATMQNEPPPAGGPAREPGGDGVRAGG